jgi:hypothetical protein
MRCFGRHSWAISGFSAATDLVLDNALPVPTAETLYRAYIAQFTNW